MARSRRSNPGPWPGTRFRHKDSVISLESQLISTINHNRSPLIDVDPINSTVIFVVPLKVFSQRLIFIVRNVFLNLDDYKSSHRSGAILAILCCPFFRKPLKTITLISGGELFYKKVSLFVQVAMFAAWWSEKHADCESNNEEYFPHILLYRLAIFTTIYSLPSFVKSSSRNVLGKYQVGEPGCGRNPGLMRNCL